MKDLFSCIAYLVRKKSLDKQTDKIFLEVYFQEGKGSALDKSTGELEVFRFESLTLKAPNKNCSRRHFNFFTLSFEENKA